MGKILNRFRRRKIAAGFLAGCLLFLSGCGTEKGEEFSQGITAPAGVTLSIQEVSPVGVTYTIDNQSQQDYSYGRNYQLLREDKGKWYVVEEKNPGIATMELLWVTAGSANTEELGWEDSYGSLDAGTYRLVKNIADSQQNYNIAGEFTID